VYAHNIHQLSFCFSAECVEWFFGQVEGSFIFLYWAGVVASGVGTFGAIILALLTYAETQKMNNLSKHVAEYERFSSYVGGVAGRFGLISEQSIDAMVWYNLIFSAPKSGDFNISAEYIQLIYDINNQVSNSDEQYLTAGGRFKYKDHQYKISALLKRLGILIEPGPRSDFGFAEADILRLVNRVNQFFAAECFAQIEIKMPKYI